MRQFVVLFLIFSVSVFGQDIDQKLKELSYNEYLGFVKKYHPLVKNANLEINKAQANLMMARGGFDPKIEVDFSQKQFKQSEYFSILKFRDYWKGEIVIDNNNMEFSYHGYSNRYGLIYIKPKNIPYIRNSESFENK